MQLNFSLKNSGFKRLYPVKLFTVLLVFAALLAAPKANAQKLIKDYVKAKTVAIATIEPDSINYSDLQVIGDAIGNASVVMLGEQDHGDAPTFLAKTRLIKYLHEKKGFNVLAFESDFFGMNDGWDKLKKAKPEMDDFLLKNVFSIWTVCNTCSNLFYNYIPATYKTSQPLIISGFDSQQYLNYSYHNLPRRLDSLFKSYNLPITRQANYSTALLPFIDSPKRWIFFPPKDTVNVNKCMSDLLQMRTELVSADKSNAFWTLVLDNLIQQTQAVLITFKTGKPANNERDIQMAKNLKWLIEHKFKGQKIIVWAASAHVAKSLTNMKQAFFSNQQTMGDNLVKALDKAYPVYVLGFTSYQGTAGRLGSKEYKLNSPRSNAFENWIDKNYKYAFVDFDQFNTLNPNAQEDFYMMGLGHRDYEGKWNLIYDGVFYIKDMYPCLRNVDLKIN